MNKKVLYLVLLLALTAKGVMNAQDQDLNLQRVADSLRKALVVAKHDTDKLNLRYKIASKTGATRISLWDSLQSDAVKYGMIRLECRILSHSAYVSAVEHNTDKAIAYYLVAISKAEAGKYTFELMYLYNGIAGVYSTQNNVTKAIENYYKALKAAEALNNYTMMSMIYNGISRMHFFMGENDKALKINLRSLALAKKTNNIESMAMALNDIGSNYRALNDTQNTIRYYREGGKYIKDVSTGLQVELYNSLGAAYELQHQPDSALRYYQRSLQISKTYSYTAGLVSSLSLIGYNYFMAGNFEAAEKQLTAGIGLAKSIGFAEEITRMAIVLKKIHEKNGNYKEALGAYELYVNTKDSTYNEKNRKLAMQKEFDYEFEKKESQNQLLVQENQIQLLQLHQNRYLLLGLAGLLALALIIAYLFIRQNKLRTGQQSARLEQKLLISQMNPHFIFNSLQAIQSFILKHDEKEAIKYLSSFAALTRNVLENSRMDAIPLKKEIALLENYLQLQNLRFKKRFTYGITVDAGIDPEHTAIPPMLSQPFIENAVEHGFHGTDREGHITVAYTLHHNRLMVEITDNGSGMKDGYSQSKQHRSLALDITRERVALMNKKTKEKTVFEIGEAFPNDRERKGVRIRFSIPLQLHYL